MNLVRETQMKAQYGPQKKLVARHEQRMRGYILSMVKVALWVGLTKASNLRR